MKFEANIEAVILWQSVQLQTNVSTRPGFWRGWEVLEWVGGIGVGRGEWTYEGELDCAAETCRCCFGFRGPAVAGATGKREILLGFVDSGSHD